MNKFLQSTLEYAKYLKFYLKLQHTSKYLRSKYSSNTHFENGNNSHYILPSSNPDEPHTREHMYVAYIVNDLLEDRFTNSKLEAQIFKQAQEYLQDFARDKKFIPFSRAFFSPLCKNIKDANWFGTEKSLSIDPTNIQRGIEKNQLFYSRIIDFVAAACDTFKMDKKEILSIFAIEIFHNIIFRSSTHDVAKKNETKVNFQLHCWNEKEFHDLVLFFYKPLHVHGVYFKDSAQLLTNVCQAITNGYQYQVNNLPKTSPELAKTNQHPLYFTSYFLLMRKNEEFPTYVAGINSEKELLDRASNIEEAFLEKQIFSKALPITLSEEPMPSASVLNKKKAHKI